MTPDMTETAFKKACDGYGFTKDFLGYYVLPNGVHVNILNAGRRRREQLKYLIKESEKKQ